MLRCGSDTRPLSITERGEGKITDTLAQAETERRREAGGTAPSPSPGCGCPTCMAGEAAHPIGNTPRTRLYMKYIEYCYQCPNQLERSSRATRPGSEIEEPCVVERCRAMGEPEEIARQIGIRFRDDPPAQPPAWCPLTLVEP